MPAIRVIILFLNIDVIHSIFCVTSIQSLALVSIASVQYDAVLNLVMTGAEQYVPSLADIVQY